MTVADPSPRWSDPVPGQVRPDGVTRYDGVAYAILPGVRPLLMDVWVDYRLSGEAKFPAQLHDLKAAIRYLRQYAGALGIDGERIGIGGESAGGHLAAL